CLDYMMSLMIKVVKGMTVNKAQMLENIGRSYNVFFSQQLLLKMVEKGMIREKAYRIVQKNAHDAFDEKVLFDDKIKADKTVQEMFKQKELDEIFSFKKYTNNVDFIFKRVFN
ncbi:adenylosuccinate lyase, partial [Candidatus Marinamargulisbacteria bacterium SCGC AAA071-K20]